MIKELNFVTIKVESRSHTPFALRFNEVPTSMCIDCVCTILTNFYLYKYATTGDMIKCFTNAVIITITKVMVKLFLIYPPDIDHSPYVGVEPLFCVLTGLVLADENGVWHWEEPHQSAVLQVLQPLVLTLYLTVHVCSGGGGQFYITADRAAMHYL